MGDWSVFLKEGEHIPTATLSAVAFYFSLALLQPLAAAVKYPCAQPLLANVLGLAWVAGVSVQCAHGSRQLAHARHTRLSQDSKVRRHLRNDRPTSQASTPAPLTVQQALKDAVVGICIFLAVGGRPSRLLPSNLVVPGACRTMAIEATPGKHATQEERRFLQTIYKRHGCHSCGGVKEKMIADHQPPTKLFENPSKWVQRLLRGTRQMLYPQCATCSNLQSQAVRWGKTKLVLHVWLMRRPQVALPGFLIGYFNTS